jgi:hypothetical protein
MKDVILWTAVFGPGVLIVAGVFVLGLCKAAARGDEQMERAARSDHYSGHGSMNLTQREYDYYLAHGKTLPCAPSTFWERPRVLRSSTTPDQSGDSRRRGDC